MKQLLSDLVKNWWTNPLPVIKNRDVDLLSYFDPTVRKIISVVGFRRIGKTFTLLDFAQKYGKEKCVYINFEDERVPKKTEEGLRPLILADYLSSFVDRDIVERYKLRNKAAFTDLLRLLPNAKSYTYSKLANSLKGIGHTVSKATVIRYMQWLEWSFFLSRVEVFSSNVKSRIQTIKKLYLVDNYFSSYFTSTLSPNYGHLMEQVVFHALHRCSVWDSRYSLTYWKDYSGNEVDFVVLYNKAVEELIQVTFASSMVEVSERETKALVKAAKILKKPSGTLITWDVEQTAVVDGVEVKYKPLWKWLGIRITADQKDIELPDDIPVLDIEPNVGGKGGSSGQ